VPTTTNPKGRGKHERRETRGGRETSREEGNEKRAESLHANVLGFLSSNPSQWFGLFVFTVTL